MKAKGPVGYIEWDKALSSPLTVENARYMSLGKLAKKQHYGTLFNRISDYVLNALDKAGKELDITNGHITAIYCLRRYVSCVKRLFFYKELGFIKDCDKDNLTAEIVRVAQSVISNSGCAYPDNADVQFELGILKSMLT